MELTTSFRAYRATALAGLTVVALLAVVSWLVLGPLGRTSDRLDYLEHRRIAPSLALHELRASLAEFRALELGQIVHVGDAAEVADYDQRLADTRQRLDRAWSHYAATAPEGDEARLRSSLKSRLDSYLDLHARIAEAAHAGDKAQAKALSTRQALQQRRELFTELSALIARIDQRAGPDAG
ncbi:MULTISPECIES: Tar ligand binding domain-containing protein [Xanthomonas]|uniref:Uncharacterized protein n=1 Tax=Xanthomonas arboricola TaxID=56448 RepID=A0A2S7AEN0_9XANT|nr:MULTISPECIES: Tar ligand binding domain-containing protein [Xanthomonas]MBB5737972.1 hypothetical protein [Xanthomonas sp. CFBP 8152]PPT79053.1 hypothetical protein XarbCFBP8152_11075 [Xanthomonas arboricola]PPU08041.1 hypothetical protein XarjCFBP7645_10765 [Xanthomonas arboricola]